MGVVDFFKGLLQILVGVFTGNFDLIEKGWDNLIIGLKEYFVNFKDWLIEFWSILAKVILNLLLVLKQGVVTVFSTLAELIKAPFENAFAWIKTQYEKYIEPIINAVKSFNPANIVSNAKDSIKSLGSGAVDYGKNMLNKGLNLLGLGNDEPKKALIPAYATNNNQTTYNQGGTANTTINITTNNPQMAEQVVRNQRQLDLSYIQNNYGG